MTSGIGFCALTTSVKAKIRLMLNTCFIQRRIGGKKNPIGEMDRPMGHIYRMLVSYYMCNARSSVAAKAASLKASV